jgi:riboflavin biosynthesis pyrimidine reductase
MDTLAPLDSLFELERGNVLPLPPELATLYGPLYLSSHPDRPTILSNFVTTLDGVVALNEPGHTSGGGDISGFNQHDRLVMGLLRAISDAVIVGAGTLRSVPRHLWTAEYIYPPLTGSYQQLRTSLGWPEPPLNVIVSARGEVDLQLPVFQSGKVPVLLITTAHGAERLSAERLPPSMQVRVLQSTGSLNARAILQTVRDIRRCNVILVEGGPQLMGDFFAEQALDELFLTLAPQIAGRDGQVERPGLVMGKRFAPEHPLWGTLISVKRSGSHLFLRYAYP